MLLQYCDDHVVIPMSDNNLNYRWTLLSLNYDEQIILFLVILLNCFTKYGTEKVEVGFDHQQHHETGHHIMHVTGHHATGHHASEHHASGQCMSHVDNQRQNSMEL